MAEFQVSIWTKMRFEFEKTDKSIGQIAKAFGVSPAEIRYKAIEKKWVRYKGFRGKPDDDTVKDLTKRCMIHGCEACGKESCRLCGWTVGEEQRRIHRGLCRDENGLSHFVPTKRET